MSLVENPKPRNNLIIAAILDLFLVGLAVAIFLVSGNLVWLILGIGAATVITVPLMLSAARQIKEQDNASG